MSMFNRAKVPCPVCGTPREFDLVASVNADRRPDLRTAILDGSFQREKCDSCGSAFRTPPLMTYLDMGRHQWILAQPGSDVGQWKALQEKALSIFAVAYGPEAPVEAQEMGRDIKARVVFGWGALSEKLLCSEHDLDDVNLELLKMAVLRDVPNPPLTDSNELRLIGVEDPELILAWIDSQTEQITNTLRVPRDLYDEIAADNDVWRPLREELSTNPFVDFNRLILADLEEDAVSDEGGGALEASANVAQPASNEPERPAKKSAGAKPKPAAKSKAKPPSPKAAKKKKKGK